METLLQLLGNLKNVTQKGIVFVESGKEDDSHSYSELYAQAVDVLGDLQSIGIKRNDYVVMQVKKNKDTVLLLWACLLGGIVAVPLTYAHAEDALVKLKNVIDVLPNSHIIGDSTVRLMMLEKGYFNGTEKYRDIAEIKSSHIGSISEDVTDFDIALIQFSSGTTGIPKGVMLTNKNIFTNLRAISKAARLNAVPPYHDVGVSWLPLTNDLGLVGLHLSGIYLMENVVMIDAMTFFYEPDVLFDKIEKYKGTITINPNFALDYLLGYFIRKNDFSKKYDLSSLRLNLCGSEPIKPQTIEQFEKMCSAFSMKPNTVMPVYGLAEACLAVAFSPVDNPYTCIKLNRDHLTLGDRIQLAENETDTVSFVSVGQAVPDIQISIRDEDNTPIGDGCIGIVYISGDSITSGYINNSEATKDLFSVDGWLNTNDIGVIYENRLYIIGRKKDMIIVHGKNYYCIDLEKLISQNIKLESAVVSEFNTETKSDDITVFVLSETGDVDTLTVENSIRDILMRHIGISVEEVCCVKNFPRTEGGKVRRFLLKKHICFRDAVGDKPIA